MAVPAGWDLHDDAPPPVDPFDLARGWLPADDAPDRPQAVLSTLGADGCPDSRTVLLTAFDRTGFAFHTSRSSRKVAQLAALPSASLLLLWPGFTRQLVLRGPVVPDDAAGQGRAWAARSDHLRRLAWLNTDEFAALDRAERRRRWAGGLPDGTAPSWVGYRVRPTELTFWAGGVDTASRRLRYTRAAEGWTHRYLAG